MMKINIIFRHALVISLIMCTFTFVNAQISVVIGTGTNTNPNTDYPSPYGNWYWGARHQFLVPASDIIAAGGQIGQIVGLGFNVAQVNGVPLQGFEIRMGHTTISQLSTNFAGGLTTVYSTQSYTEISGWNHHNFGTPFIWNGTDNIIVETCFNNNSYTNNASVYQTNTSYNSSLYYREDNSNACSNPSGTTANMRPNMTIHIMPAQSFANDLALTSIVGPQSGVGLGNNMNVALQIANTGTQAQTGFTLGYSLNSGPWVTQYFNQTLNPDDTSLFIMPQTIDLSNPGQYVLKAFVNLPNDSAWWNDTLVKHISSYPVISQLPYYNRFGDNFPDNKLLYQRGSNVVEDRSVRGLLDSRVLIWKAEDNHGGYVNGGGMAFGSPSAVGPNEANLTFYVDKTGLSNPAFRMRFRQEYAYNPEDSQLRIFINDSNVTMAPGGYHKPQTNSSDPWDGRVYDLSSYPGNIVKVSIHANLYPVWESEYMNAVCLDEIVVYNKQTVDLSVAAWNGPGPMINTGFHPISISVTNYGTSAQSNFPATYTLDMGQTMITNTVATTVNPGDTILYTFPQNHDFTTLGNYIGGVLVNHVNDADRKNDTLYEVRIFAGEPLNGTYTLGNRPSDIPDIKTLSSVLNNYGLGGHAIINIKDGWYNDKLVIDDVSGLSDTSRLTIQSLSLDSSKVVLDYKHSNYYNYIVALYDCSHITLNKIGFNLPMDYLTAVAFDNNVSDIHITNCNFMGYNNTNGNFIQAYGVSKALFENNRFEGMGNSVALYGAENIILRNNVFNSFNYSGVRINNYSNVKIEENYFKSRWVGYSGKSAINLETMAGDSLIVNANFIELESGSDLYGIRISGFLSDTSIRVIASNNVVNLSGGNNSRCIAMFNGTNATVAHNSVRMTDCSSSSYAFDLGNVNGIVRNNSINVLNNGRIYGIGGTASITSNFNHFYTNLTESNPNVILFNWMGNAYDQSGITWSGQEVNSVWGNPLYSDYPEIRTNSPILDNKGTAMPIVPFDRDGNLRSTTTPDIGAYEFTSPANDMMVTSILSPSNYSIQAGVNIPVSVEIFNAGSQAQSNVPVKYQIGNGSVVSETFAGTINSLASVTMHFSTPINISGFGVNDFKVYVDNPGDLDRSNDTLKSFIVTCGQPLSGTFTVGGTGADFSKIQHAAIALQHCGIGGPVNILINSGTYREAIFFRNIPGSDTSKIVTVRSATQNAADVIIEPIPSQGMSYSFFGCIASNIRLEDFTINNHNSSEAGGIFMQHCDNVIVDGVIFNHLANNPSGYSYALVGENSFSNLTVRNCQFNNFTHVISLNDNGNNPSHDLTIINNEMNNFIEGVKVIYTSGLHMENNRLFSNRARTGVDLERIWNTPIVKNNHIAISGIGDYTAGMLIGNSMGGIYITSPSGHKGYIYNNFISVSGNGQNGVFGLLMQESADIDFVFNSVNVHNSNTFSTALLYDYVVSSNILNNNIANQTGGLAFMSYTGTSTASYTMGYNNLFSSGSNLANINNSNFPNLAALQSVGLANNSLSVPPAYFSDTDLHTNAVELNGAGQSISIVVHDFDYEPRQVPPDIGADEFTPVFPVDIALSDLRLTSLCPGYGELLVTVTNAGTDNITSFAVVYNDNFADTIHWAGLLLPDSSLTISLTQGMVPPGAAFGGHAKGIMPNNVNDMNPLNNLATSFFQTYNYPPGSISMPSLVCNNGDTITIGLSPLGGVLTGNGVSGSSFIPSMASLGANELIYTWTDTNSCIGADTIIVNLVQAPSVQIDTILNTYCIDHPAIQLTANPAGGNFRINGLVYYSIYPNILGQGSNHLTYEYYDTNNCYGFDEKYFDILPLPTVSFGALANVCHNDAPFTLTGGLPTGGTYSGAGVNAGIFNPSAVSPASHQITYSYTDINGCTNSDIETILVNAIAGVTFFGLPSDMCSGGQSVTLSGYPAGGSFSGIGISGNVFNPTVAAPGNHAVIYTYIDANSCANADTQYVQVHAPPVVSFANPANVCEDSPSFALIGGTPSGGVYSGTGVLGGSFFPMIAGNGTHTLSYTYTDANSCTNFDTAQIIVTPQPTSTFTTNSPVCFGDTMTVTYTGSASAAASYTWNFGGGTVVSGSGQGPYSIIWPTSGVKQLSLTVSENGCTSQSTSTLVIVHSNDAFVSAAGGTSFCEGDSLLMVANAGTGLTYQWYRNDTIIPGAVQNLYYAHSSGNFSVQVGTSYGCMAKSNQVTTNLFPIPLPSFSLPAMACANDTITITYTGNATTGAIYNWGLDNGQTSSSGQGPLDVVWSSPGPKLITLQVSENGCQSPMHNEQIMINTTPAAATAPGNTTFCNGESVTLFANSGANLTYQWLRDGNPITGATQSFYTANQTGNYSVVVTNTATTCAAESNQIPVMVNTTNFNLAFSASSTSLSTPPFLVAFSNQTPNTANYYYTWDFGDGNTSSFSEPFHQYMYDGTYSVTLYAQNIFTGCRDTLKKTNYIICSGGTPNPCTITAVINQGGSSVMCSGDSMLVTANVSGAQGAVSYQWFIDGVLQPNKTTASFMTKVNGLYRVIVTDTVCSFTSSAFIIAYYPVVKPSILSFDTLTPCSNDSMMLQVATYYSSYLWSTGATTQEIYVSQSGHYFVTATDANGCKQVSEPFVVNASLLQPPPICIVGVDSNNFNTVVWERPITNLIDSFYIYRETTVANVYQRIGGVAYNDFSAFVDSAANPAQRSWRYRLTAIDTCSMESPFSTIHKTIHLTINKGLPGTWNLIWDGYQGFNFGSYNIYRGTDSTNMSLLTQIQSNLNSYTDLNPPSDTVFYQIEVVNPFGCNPSKAMNYNSSRSNQASTMAYIIPDTTGIQQIRDAGFSMNVYPNPNSGAFTLSINSSKSSRMEAVIYNSLGQAVHSETFDVNGRLYKDISLEHLHQGVYILRLSSADGSLVNRIVIQR